MSPQDESHIQNSFTQVTKSQICPVHDYSFKNQPSIHLSMHNNTCFGISLCYVGTHHGNMLKSLATTNTVTYILFGTTEHGDLYFISRDHRTRWHIFYSVGPQNTVTYILFRGTTEHGDIYFIPRDHRTRWHIFYFAGPQNTATYILFRGTTEHGDLYFIPLDHRTRWPIFYSAGPHGKLR